VANVVGFFKVLAKWATADAKLASRQPSPPASGAEVDIAAAHRPIAARRITHDDTLEAEQALRQSGGRK
jgi:hypothetical protein